MQNKIGYDKFPVPSINGEAPLFDIVTGEKLVDQSGLPLVTDARLTVSEIARANRATPTVMSSNAEPIRVVEQFPETTEISTTLLGINRAEEQLSLFSDVSVLGFDEDNWETYSFGTGLSLGAWNSRGTRNFGAHYGARMIEETQEQAIQLGAFPVPYSYPFGPGWADLGRYNEELYPQYLEFIRLGNFLYEYYKVNFPSEVDFKGRPFYDNFLDYDKVRIGNGDEIDFIGITDDEGFVLIDTWTRAWVDIQTSSFFDPIAGGAISPLYINNLPSTIGGFSISRPLFSDTRPGYSTSNRSYVYMQSRKAYRYQPGRISGYTFGAKSSTDAGSNQNIIEWGITNPTDQYVFQIRGASFSIVRRSTIPLSEETLKSQDLTLDDQTFESSGDPFNSRSYHTIVIPREKFNGDTLDGNGRSGYLLNPNNVTMYKIEFGWYGAIGAKFYVYIPVENGEARWVLVHTLVIENKLNQPCLEDPYFRFKYSVDIRNTATLKDPQFIYKYGASCFIDGGDEGTVIQRSYTSGERNISSSPKPILGVYPKLNILNKDSISKPNKKIIYPKSATLSATSLALVEVVKCKACPGFAFGHNHGLASEESGRTVNFKLVDLSRIRIIPADPLNPTPNELFSDFDKGAKIIADGLWVSYIDELEGETSVGSGLYDTAKIVRVSSSETYPSVVKPRGSTELLTLPIGTQYPYPARISQYSAVAASTTPLTGSKIEVLFLNRTPYDETGHTAEFLFGLTDKKPIEDFDTSGDPIIKWEYGAGDIRDELLLDNIVYREYRAGGTGRTRAGIETGELSNVAGRIDRRLPSIPGTTGGICSRFAFEILDKDVKDGVMVQNNPETSETDGLFYIKLVSNTQFSSDVLLGGEVGLFDGTDYTATGVTFTSDPQFYQEGDDVIFYASLSEQLPGVSINDSVQIAMTPITIAGGVTRVLRFNPFPLYLVAKMRDNSSVNSISVRETIGETQISSTPSWLLDQRSFIFPEINNPAQDDLLPVNFDSINRLDAASVDTQLEQTLRQFEVIDSFHIGANETKQVDFSNIFGSDRESITPDVLNREATFFIARSLDGTTGTIQLSLNTAEQ